MNGLEALFIGWNRIRLMREAINLSCRRNTKNFFSAVHHVFKSDFEFVCLVAGKVKGDAKLWYDGEHGPMVKFFKRPKGEAAFYGVYKRALHIWLQMTKKNHKPHEVIHPTLWFLISHEYPARGLISVERTTQIRYAPLFEWCVYTTQRHKSGACMVVSVRMSKFKMETDISMPLVCTRTPTELEFNYQVLYGEMIAYAKELSEKWILMGQVKSSKTHASDWNVSASELWQLFLDKVTHFAAAAQKSVFSQRYFVELVKDVMGIDEYKVMDRMVLRKRDFIPVDQMMNNN